MLEATIPIGYIGYLRAYQTGNSMSLRYRFIRPEDWLTGVNLVLQHPEFGPQYSGKWVRSAPSGRNLRPRHRRINASSKTTPFLWLGPELANRIADGKTHFCLTPTFDDRIPLPESIWCRGLWDRVFKIVTALN